MGDKAGKALHSEDWERERKCIWELLFRLRFLKRQNESICWLFTGSVLQTVYQGAGKKLFSHLFFFSKQVDVERDDWLCAQHEALFCPNSAVIIANTLF